MGHENQKSVNVEDLVRQNPESGGTLAGSFYAQNSADSSLPRQTFTGAQNVLDKSIDNGKPLQIDGAQLASDNTGGRTPSDPSGNRALMEQIMKAHDRYYEDHRSLPLKKTLPAYNPFNPTTRPNDAAKPATPTVDQARKDRQKVLTKDKPEEIGTSNGEDAGDTKEHSAELAKFKKLAHDQGVPLVVCITRSDELPDDLPRPMKAGWEAQAKQSKEMEKVMADLAKEQWGNVLVVKMEACPSAAVVAQQQLKWTLGKEGRGRNAELVVAPQVMVVLPNGQHHVIKHKTTLDEVKKLAFNK